MNAVTWKDWNVTSSSDGRVCTAQPFRYLNGKVAKGAMYGRQFRTSDEAHAAMLAHGYAQPHFSRSSVPCLAFASLKSERQACEFDWLYRLWKWKVRRGLRMLELRDRLAKLAKQVTIFHPATKRFLTPNNQPERNRTT